MTLGPRGRAVDFVTPTLARPDVHEQLYEGFAGQTLPKKRLFVLDESREASPFFSGLNDPRVKYVHQPNSSLSGAGQGGIARARNALLRMTSAPVVAHMDDDDIYSPDYGAVMVDRLLSKGSDLAKLVVWNMLHEKQGSVWQWDTRRFTGKVWAVKGSELPQEMQVDESIDPQLSQEMRDAWAIGFGFSYVYKRALWEQFPFPEDESTEDIPWVRACRAAGAKIDFIADLPHVVLHTVHPRSESPNFPQRRIGVAANLTELPRGKPIAVVPGTAYEVLAKVKDKHSLKSLVKRAAQWGISVDSAQDNVQGQSYGVSGAPSGYRLVFLAASASRAGTMPWGVPSPLSIFDGTSVVRAWRVGGKMTAGLPSKVVLVREGRR